MCKTGNHLYIISELKVVPDVSSAHSDIIFDGKMTLFHRYSDNRNTLFLPMKQSVSAFKTNCFHYYNKNETS